MPKPHDVVFFETHAQLRAWFEANHDQADELWVGYHRKRTGRPSVTWQELVDQELCFGWIDSVRYSIGDDRTAQRITPRRKRSIWSAVNVKRFAELDRLVCTKEVAPRSRRERARDRRSTPTRIGRAALTQLTRRCFASKKRRGNSSSRRRRGQTDGDLLGDERQA